MRILTVVTAASFLLPLGAQVNFSVYPARVMGQINSTSYGLNLIEGREFYGPQGVALDTTTSPPRLYVVDTGNNRVLGWHDAYNFANGAKADIVVGQPDFTTTVYWGPGTTLTSGLSSPVSAAVDKYGHLWVADAGNNRILRYKSPFNQPDQVKAADFVVGQPNLNSRTANNRFITDTAVNARGIAMNPNGGIPCNPCLSTNLQFDPSGNLWYVDAGNQRVLRFPGTSLPGAGDASISPDGVRADMVIGQTSFTTNTATTADFNGRIQKKLLYIPGALALDPSGNLWVSDQLQRALLFKAPLFTGMSASRVLGIPNVTQGSTVPNPNEVGGCVGVTSVCTSYSGFFFAGGNPYLVDQGLSRILRFDSPDKWTPEDTTSQALTAYSPAAIGVIGQDDFNSGFPNRGLTVETNDSSYSQPTDAVVAPNGEVFITDMGNNRVVVLPSPIGGPAMATRGAPYQFRRILGQDAGYGNAVNLIEGRELASVSVLPTGSAATVGMGLTIDYKSTPPHLYVADTGNNRVLGFKDARNIRPGDRADLVIGQADMTRRMVNSPNNDPRLPTATGLWLPTAVAVDANGNLYVADFGNGRVVRFPSPFNQTAGQTADLVLGQVNLTSVSTDVTARTMGGPYGLAFTADGSLAVSDFQNNRVLFFPQPLSSGMSATKVFGQQNFTSRSPGSGPMQLNGVYGVAIDNDDRLYVCDLGNSRLQLFERIPSAQDTGASAGFSVQGISGPLSVDVSTINGEIWVAAAQAGLTYRFPTYVNLIANPQPNTGIPSIGAPLAVKVDPFNNPIVADSANRLAMYFPLVQVTNGASNFMNPTPGAISALKMQILGPKLTTGTVAASGAQGAAWPKTLGDAQVFVNDSPAGIFAMCQECGDPNDLRNQINFQMPRLAPTNGTADVYVQRQSTGQILGSSRIAMYASSPAFFTNDYTGKGQVAALNQDNSRNGVLAPTATPPTKPAKYGEVVQLFLTGQGYFDGMPADGDAAPLALSPFPAQDLLVLIGGKSADVQYSGLAPGYVGLWQLNAVVPAGVAGPEGNPPWTVQVVVRYKGAISTQGVDPKTGNLLTLSPTTSIKVQPN